MFWLIVSVVIGVALCVWGYPGFLKILGLLFSDR